MRPIGMQAIQTRSSLGIERHNTPLFLARHMVFGLTWHNIHDYTSFQMVKHSTTQTQHYSWHNLICYDFIENTTNTTCERSNTNHDPIIVTRRWIDVFILVMHHYIFADHKYIHQTVLPMTKFTVTISIMFFGNKNSFWEATKNSFSWFNLTYNSKGYNLCHVILPY